MPQGKMKTKIQLPDSIKKKKIKGPAISKRGSELTLQIFVLKSVLQNLRFVLIKSLLATYK